VLLGPALAIAQFLLRTQLCEKARARGEWGRRVERHKRFGCVHCRENMEVWEDSPTSCGLLFGGLLSPNIRAAQREFAAGNSLRDVRAEARFYMSGCDS
jgi:hypothetical protein